MTDRIAVMRDGVMQQIGTADEIYNRPVNAFVAQFFGLHSMNVFEVTDIQQAPSLSGKCGAQAVRLPASVTPHLAGTTRSLSIGARPAMISVFPQGEGPQGSNTLTLSGRVYVAEQLGDSILVTVQAGDATIQAMTPPDRHFAIDQPVDLAIPDEALYIFEGPGKMTGRHGKSQSGLLPTALSSSFA
mgnify:FL=1